MRSNWLRSLCAMIALSVNLVFVQPAHSTGETYDLLIVTVDRFLTEANRLAEWKQQLGFRTKVISQSVWADPEHSNIISIYPDEEFMPYSTLDDNTVRQAIAPYISENGVKYLLLIGNPDDILPVQVEHNKCYSPECHARGRFTDLFYAGSSPVEDKFLLPLHPADECLSGSYDDCDCKKPVPGINTTGELVFEDGYFCSYTDYLAAIDEPQQTENYYPEVAYGRISVETPSELSAVVDKIINFEKYPSTNSNYYDKFIVASTGYGTGAGLFIPYAKEVYNWMISQGRSGPSVEKPYFFWDTYEYWLDGWLYYPVPPGDISAAIQAGAFFVLHRDHGYQNGWKQPEYRNADIALLTNTNLPFVFNMDCETGTLNQNGFGNKFVSNANGGAIAVVGAEGITYSTPNDLLARACAYLVLPGDFSGITDMDLSLITPAQSPRIGDILNTAKMIMEENLNNRYMALHYFERYNIAGDPTVNVVTNLPSQITATYQNSFTLGTTSMDITDISCPSGMITLVADGELIARQEFTGNSVTLNFDPVATEGIAILTISSYGYIPLIDQITFSGTGFNFTATPSVIPAGTPVFLSYTIPPAYAGATVSVIEHRLWNNEVRTDYNQVPLSGDAGDHEYGPVWFWNKWYFGTTSGPYTIDLQINGVVVESIQISFSY